MIKLDLPPDTSRAERWAMETLVDLSRLLPAEDGVTGVTRLSVGEGSGFEREDGMVRVGRKTLARVVAVAGAGTEQGSTERDQHDRVPAEENPLVAEGTERRPEVQRLAAQLRESVVAAAGTRPVRCITPWPGTHRWAMAMTHDLDVVSGWPVFTGARLMELAGKGRFGDLARVLGAAARSIGGTPVMDGLRQVLAVEDRLGVSSTWFVLVGDPTLARWRRGDVTYRLEDKGARACLEAIVNAGHEVGLHGSMETLTDAAAFAREKARLEAAADIALLGVRQHFLKMRPGLTQAAMQEAGFEYDATYGFSGRNGFRLGVADIVWAWDAREGTGRELALVPLHWMDRALSKYQGVEDPQALVADGLALAEVARAEQGLWVGLWHPNLTPALGYPGAPEAFETLVTKLVDHDPWMATLSEIVEWRTIRRSARGTSIDGNGHVMVAYDDPNATDRDLFLEDEKGRKVA